MNKPNMFSSTLYKYKILWFYEFCGSYGKNTVVVKYIQQGNYFHHLTFQ